MRWRCAGLPSMRGDLCRQRFRLIEKGELHAVAAAFTFGREDLIPEMFRGFIRDLDARRRDGGVKTLRWYLDRHIEVDGEDHGPMALRMVAELCGGGCASGARQQRPRRPRCGRGSRCGINGKRLQEKRVELPAWILKKQVSHLSDHMNHRRRSLCGAVSRGSDESKLVQSFFYSGGYEKDGAVFWLEDALGDGVIEEVEQAVVEAVRR